MGELSDAVRELPPLLFLLEKRVSGRGGNARGQRIPIDADALEIWGQIRDTLRGWANQVHSLFDAYDLVGSFTGWVERFAATVVPDSVRDEKILILESWVARITTKYSHPEVREWKSPCPQCGKARILVDRNGERVTAYAVVLNVTDRVAECTQCGERFDGDAGLARLRVLTNVREQLQSGVRPEDAAYEAYLEYQRSVGVSDVANYTHVS